jgi:hypothetical protein
VRPATSLAEPDSTTDGLFASSKKDKLKIKHSSFYQDFEATAAE